MFDIGQILQILIFLLLLITFGYLTGTYRERKHYKSIHKREIETLYLPMVTMGAKQSLPEAKETKLLISCVVISVDSFKRASAALRHAVGGHIIGYETLLDRGRREALLRLKARAIEWGASQVLNVRFETATISGDSGNRKIGTVEIIVYGTGIK